MFNTFSPNLFETVETKGETLKPFWQLLKAPESTLVVNQVIIKWVAVLYESSFEAWELDFRRTGHLSIDCEGTCSLTWLLHLSFLLQIRCQHFENLIWIIIQKYIYRERSQFQMYLESGIKMHIQEYVVHLYDKQSVYMNWWYLGLQSVYHILHTDTPRMLPAHKCNS